jgi:hypothetical protein
MLRLSGFHMLIEALARGVAEARRLGIVTEPATVTVPTTTSS